MVMMMNCMPRQAGTTLASQETRRLDCQMDGNAFVLYITLQRL